MVIFSPESGDRSEKSKMWAAMNSPGGTFLAAVVKIFAVLTQPPPDPLQLSGGPLSPQLHSHCQLPHAPPTPTEPRPFTIIVEGTVGCGKSTLLDIVSSLPGVMVVPEPVSEWQNVNGTDLLQLMIEDGPRWSGLFQMEATLSRLKAALQKAVDARGRPALVRIMERSLYSERYCFLEQLKRTNTISDPEYFVMDRWHKFAVENFEPQIKPDLIVFLKTDLETVSERIQRRGREEEQNIDLNFVDGINKLHEDWLLHRNSSFPVPAPVVVMNGTLSLEDFKQYVHQNIDQIIPADLQPYILNH